MGLTGTHSWTRNASTNNTTNCESYGVGGGALGANTKINSRYNFVYRYYQSIDDTEYKIEKCICTIKTDASGCSSLSFTCTNAERDLPNRIYWKVSATKSLDTGSMTECTFSNNSLSGTLSVKLLPNTTYYVLFYASQSGNYCSACMYGTLTINGTGTYGAPGDITAKNSTLGVAQTVSWASTTSGAKYKVKAVSTKTDGTTYTQWLAGSANSTVSTSSVSWTPAIETYAPLVTNAKTISCTITSETFFGGVSAGTKSKTITLTIPDSVKPTTSSAFSIAPLNEGVISGMSGYIQGYSKIRASYDSTNVTLNYGASISGWSVKFGSAAAVNVNAGTATKDSGIISAVTTVVCTVTDSRGFTASETYETTITPYENPALTATIKRTDSNGDEDDAGTYLRIDLAGWYSDIAGQNTQTSVVRRKLASASSYDSDIAITTGSTTLSDTRKLYGVANFLVSGMTDAVYNVQVEITDALGNKAVATAVMESQHWAIHFRNKGAGAAFGKAAERDSELDIGAWSLTCGELNPTTPLAAEYGGTGADDAITGLTNLGGRPWKASNAITASGTASRTLTFSGTARGVFFTSGGAAARMSMYMFYSNGTTTTVAKEVVAGSAITVTTVDNKLTVTTSASANQYIYIMFFNSSSYSNTTIS